MDSRACGRACRPVPAPSVDILLATWNGARFLREQVDSVLAQDDQDWRLLIRDDGSTDDTSAIIADYAARHPGRVVAVDCPSAGKGALGNFGALLAASSAPYVMCCDQDDAWIPGKVALTRARMRQLEAEHGAGKPLIVHTDLAVVDGDMRELCPSLWQFQGIDPRLDRLNRLLVQNVITGCAMMANRRCLELSLPVPASAMMHDWWMGLVACAFGAIAWDPTPTVRYRQHGGNTLGAQAYSGWEVLKKAAAKARLPKLNARYRIEANLAQGRAFLARYRATLPPRHLRTVEAYVRLGEAGWFSRRGLVLRHGFWKIGAMRNLVWFGRI